MEENDEKKTFAEWWDVLERDGAKLAGATFFEAFRRSKKELTFEEFADLCVKKVDHEIEKKDELSRRTSANYSEDLIERELVHLAFCKCIERIKDRRTAINFHDDYVEIERNKGIDEAIEFQRAQANKFGLTPPEQISVAVRGDIVIITISNI